MKCQFGLMHTTGKSATPDDLAGLLGELRRCRAETSGEILEGSLVLAYRGDRITWEEDSETQPLEKGAHVLTWDGRLDNREELADRLGLAHLQTIPDPDIVLKAYERFGTNVFRDLIGEFALTLWCRNTKKLFFARSACGARPLFYTLVNGTFFWSSDFGHIVRVSRVDLEVNEAYLLEFLVTQPDTKHTPLTKVGSVPANTLLEIVGGQINQARTLWDPTRVRTLDYCKDFQYEGHFREVLGDAVRVRLRAKPPVFAELSGGLDSSSIVLTADQILTAKNQPLDDLQTISGVYEESRTCDEHKFIRMVEERRGRKTLLVGEKEQGFTLGLENPAFTGLPNPNHCTAGRYETFSALVKEGGGRVLLTGLGGDHLFWSAPEGSPLVADQLRRGNVVAALRECRVWSQAARVPYPYLLLKRALPMAAGLPFSLLEAPNWLSSRIKRAFSRGKRDLLGNQSTRVRPSRRAQLFVVDLLLRTVGCGYYNEYTDLFVSHPYTHRPLIEFCLAATLSQFLRAGQTRSLMRRALADRLPVRICNRMSKVGADEAGIRALQREWRSHSEVSRWKVCERGLVDPSRLFLSLDNMRLGIHRQCGYLMRLVSFERWLRSLERLQAPSTGLSQERNPYVPQLVDAV